MDQKKIAANKKKFSELEQNGGGTTSECKLSANNDSSTYKSNKWDALKSGLDRESCVCVKRRIVVGTLPIPQAFIRLIRKLNYFLFSLHLPLHEEYSKVR